MKNINILFLLLVLSAMTALAQTKPRLGVIPFTGGREGDGETIATLFSFQPDIMNAFTVVPRTSAVDALIAEQNFQMAGLTDSDTIARMGRLLNADFVVSGNIRRFGNRNLIITTIVNVETFEQLAGDYHEYRDIGEIPALLSDIARIIINATKRDTTLLPNLAIVPFNIKNQDVNVQDAEVLLQILSVEIANTGKYAVLPRTTAIQAAMKELEYQMSGATAEEEAKALGKAINAKYVLSVEVRNLGSNMFTASILHVEDGSLYAGGYKNYKTTDDGMKLMAELALLLTAGDSPVASVDDPKSDDSKPPKNKTRLWTIGVSAGSSFSAPWVIGTLHGTIAPFKYSFLEIGFDAGFVSQDADVKYYSLHPFIHYCLFLPFPGKGGWYVGAGGGYFAVSYTFSEEGYDSYSDQFFLAAFTTGVNIFDAIDISYTLRTNFVGMSHKVSIGYVYRF